MIRPLRIYHFRFWRALALVLPIAFTLALVLRPVNKKERALPKEFQFDFSGSNNQGVLEIKLNNSLQSPSCLVYAVPKSGEKLLLGAISHKGTYKFTCPEKIKAVELFDIIHQKEIHTHYIDHEELP